MVRPLKTDLQAAPAVAWRAGVETRLHAREAVKPETVLEIGGAGKPFDAHRSYHDDQGAT
jgi:hypothetical protein